jgi:hypothetical protein
MPGDDASRSYHIEEDAASGSILLTCDGQPCWQTTDVAEALEHFESDLELFVAVHAPQHLFVHAGVTGWQGRAIVIPGLSRTGKTTLVAALLQAGASYYSDEHAVFDWHGQVCPYPRPLFVRGAEGCRTRLNPESFGAMAGCQAIPLGLVVVTRYVPGACWKPSPLSPGQGALALLANTPCARLRPATAMRVFERALAGAQVLAGVRGDADHTARLLLEAAERAASS